LGEGYNIPKKAREKTSTQKWVVTPFRLVKKLFEGCARCERVSNIKKKNSYMYIKTWEDGEKKKEKTAIKGAYYTACKYGTEIYQTYK